MRDELKIPGTGLVYRDVNEAVAAACALELEAERAGDPTQLLAAYELAAKIRAAICGKTFDSSVPDVLAFFDFTDSQRREVSLAFQMYPHGVERCAIRARIEGLREGRTGTGLLLWMLRNGQHRLDAKVSVRRPTGWRWVSDTASFVRDPDGTDSLPAFYEGAIA